MGLMKEKKKNSFIIFSGVFLVLIIGIIVLLFNKSNNIIDVKADEVITENNKVVENTEKKESIYLDLKNDKNADDASNVIPSIMYPGVPFEFSGQKIAYLTFDDGPSEHVTGKILDVLKKNDAKATFFTVGKVIESNPKGSELIKRMAKEGHAIANHGYSHDYNILYPNGKVNVDDFMKDFNKNNEILKKILGDDFKTRVIRMPGGHASWGGTDVLDKRLSEEGIYQTDWNALNGDAEGKTRSSQELLDKLKQSMGDKRSLIILMHDTDAKETTVEYLQSAIDYLKSQGFIFKTLK